MAGSGHYVEFCKRKDSLFNLASGFLAVFTRWNIQADHRGKLRSARVILDGMNKLLSELEEYINDR